MDDRDDALTDFEEVEDLYYSILNVDFSEHLSLFLMKHLSAEVDTRSKGFYEMKVDHLELNNGIFSYASSLPGRHSLTIRQVGDETRLFCGCLNGTSKLCEHEARALFNVHQRPSLRLFFDSRFREQQMRLKAAEYGLEQEPILSDFFMLQYEDGKTTIVAKIRGMYASSGKTNEQLAAALLPAMPFGDSDHHKMAGQSAGNRMALVFSEHRFYRHLVLTLVEGIRASDGKLKNPIQTLNPVDLIWNTADPEVIKFYSGISRFQNNYEPGGSAADLDAFKAVARNPLGLDVYMQDSGNHTNITANGLSPIALKLLNPELNLMVDVRGDFYEISGKLILDDSVLSLDQVVLKHNCFVVLKDKYHLIANENFLRLINFFKGHHDRLLIHRSKFESFQEEVLSRLEQHIRIDYSYLKAASKRQLEEKGFDLDNEAVLYLSESGEFVLFNPVIRYGDVEVPVLSRKQIRSKDRNGRSFIVARDEHAELQFIANISRQHPFFEEQLDRTDNFYLHRSRLLEDNWFLEAFDQWRKQGIAILGFNKLKNNKLSGYKANVHIAVRSGMDWFKTAIKITYGKETVALRHLQRAIRNRQRFIKLDDGTLGILPDEWIEKFSDYFNAGELVDDEILMSKINFSAVEELYERQQMDEVLQEELQMYRGKFSGGDTITEVPVPEGLNATLRRYQHEGLNWLNFLDDFNFGACLADDMGLGKTVQVIAFILSQRSKVKQNTNLVVVPASLIFNWQSEIAKFAPSIKINTIYGANRTTSVTDFNEYEVVLTSYGTLLTDIRYLKEYRFNYIFLDESQHIKNPESQRYKAARMLQSRNKVVITGTPLENNTFDLYGQLSFACPGLLGSKQYFRAIYSTPIDQFKDAKVARKLQQRINPFILRRTKRQVATELPDKTEMVIYCEMEADQRKVYDAYEKEIRDYLTNQTDTEIASDTMNVLKGIMKLRQICNSPSLLSDDGYYGASSAKMEVLLEQILSKYPQHKILVFSQFVGMLDLIRAELEKRQVSLVMLTGQTRDRQAVVDGFQNDESIRVFLISLKAGGVGLNLTQADYVYIVDPWWNPAVENQAIDRTYRIGQHKNVVAVRLICPDTVEEKIMEMQAHKRELVTDLVKTDTSISKRLTKTELLALFSHSDKL